MSEWARDVDDGCTLSVRVHPGARTNAVTGTHDGALRLSLTAPPTGGRANEALIAYLAGRLRLPRARISLVQGQTNRSKTLRIAGLSAAEAEAALSPDVFT
jgi:uncharacterized protein (TIGR00251 family)